MDVLDAELGNRHGPLAINKASSKIAKAIRRPEIAQQRPPPTVYKIEAGHFRSLVQELTGTSPAPESARPPAAPKAPAPTGNSRLQKIAPPPLRPVFSYPMFGAAQQYSPQQYPNSVPLLSPTSSGQMFNSQIFNNGVPYNAGPLSPSIVRKYSNTPLMSLLSPHAFSPVPALTTTTSDQMWANALESPTSIAMRHFAQSLNSTGNEVDLSEGLRHSGQTVYNNAPLNENLAANGMRDALQPTSNALQHDTFTSMRHPMEPMDNELNECQVPRGPVQNLGNMNDNQAITQLARGPAASVNETQALRHFAQSMGSTANETRAAVDTRFVDSNNSNYGGGRAQTVFSSNFSLSPRSYQSIGALGYY